MTTSGEIPGGGSASRRPDLILASASPRRAELLRTLGVGFQVVPADLDETPHPGESGAAHVARLAHAKAQAVDLATATGLPVLGADTTVIGNGGRLLGKPGSETEAVAMLLDLSGRTHEVCTAVALVQGDREAAVTVSTAVTFRILSAAECHAYWRSGEPADKAGGYALQGLGGVFVTRIEGSCSAVIGLPVAETYTLLQQFRVPTGLTRA
jgi:septum formation protein